MVHHRLGKYYYILYLTQLHIIQLQSHDAHGHDEEQDYYGKA